MNLSLHPKRNSAITLLDLLIVLFILAVMFAVLSRPFIMEKRKAQRERCLNNLKQVGLSFAVWSGDHGDNFPTFVSETNGSPMDFDSGPNAWRHFRILSNELSTPRILFCPAESEGRRSIASNFTAFNNSNVSYFVGLVANGSDSKKLLAGDHNITNGIPPNNGILELTANRYGGWTSEMHKREGNLSFADGSVMTAGNINLRRDIAVTTNRLLMPILAP